MDYTSVFFVLVVPLHVLPTGGVREVTSNTWDPLPSFKPTGKYNI